MASIYSGELQSYGLEYKPKTRHCCDGNNNRDPAIANLCLAISSMQLVTQASNVGQEHNPPYEIGRSRQLV